MMRESSFIGIVFGVILIAIALPLTQDEEPTPEPHNHYQINRCYGFGVKCYPVTICGDTAIYKPATGTYKSLTEQERKTLLELKTRGQHEPNDSTKPR